MLKEDTEVMKAATLVTIARSEDNHFHARIAADLAWTMCPGAIAERACCGSPYFLR